MLGIESISSLYWRIVCWFLKFVICFDFPILQQARRALRALRGLVRLKTMIQGQSVKRQATSTLRCMQTLARVQSQVRARRIRMSEDNQALQRQLQQKHEKEQEKLKAYSVSTFIMYAFHVLHSHMLYANLFRRYPWVPHHVSASSASKFETGFVLSPSLYSLCFNLCVLLSFFNLFQKEWLFLYLVIL